MAFPIVKGKATSTGAASTTHTVTLPDDIEAGELLLVFFAHIGRYSNTAEVDEESSGPGWHSLRYYRYGLSNSTNGATIGVFYKRADGNESTLVIKTPASVASAHIVYRLAQAESVSSSATGYYGSNANPPNHNISVTKDALWFAAVSKRGAAPSAGPSGYSDFTVSSGSNINCASAYLDLRASSNNPGAFTSGNNYWAAVTVAVIGRIEANTELSSRAILTARPWYGVGAKFESASTFSPSAVRAGNGYSSLTATFAVPDVEAFQSFFVRARLRAWPYLIPKINRHRQRRAKLYVQFSFSTTATRPKESDSALSIGIALHAHAQRWRHIINDYPRSHLVGLYRIPYGCYMEHDNPTTPVKIGDPVGFVTDLSNSGNHLVAPSPGARPTLRRDAHGYYLEFDGVDDELRAVGLSNLFYDRSFTLVGLLRGNKVQNAPLFGVFNDPFGASLEARFSLGAISERFRHRGALLPGHTYANALADRLRFAVFDLKGLGTLTAVPNKISSCDASLDASVTTDGSAYKIADRPVQLSASAAVSVAGTKYVHAAFSATISASLNAEAIRPRDASVQLSASASLSAEGNEVVIADGSLSAAAQVAASALRYSNASAALASSTSFAMQVSSAYEMLGDDSGFAIDFTDDNFLGDEGHYGSMIVRD